MLLAFFVLLVASTMMLVLADAGLVMRFRLGGYLAELFPEEQVRLESLRGALGPMAIETQTITEETVSRVAALPQVRLVQPIEPVRLPVAVEGQVFGQGLRSDAVIHGVPREMVADAIGEDVAWSMPEDADEPFPIVASQYFLDLYNLGLARASGMPLIAPNAIIGRTFYIVFGQSSVIPMAVPQQTNVVAAKLVGLSDNPALIGLAMPADAVRLFNKAFGGMDEPQYVQLVVTLEPGADTDAFMERARTIGLEMTGGEVIGRQLKSGVRLAGWGLIGLALGVFALGLMTFHMLFTMIFHARRIDLVRLRALGVGSGRLLAVAVGEVAVPALTAVAIAMAASHLLIGWAGRAAGEWLQGQSWLPGDLLVPSPVWLAAYGGAILLATLLAALPALRWVFRVEPGEVIRDL